MSTQSPQLHIAQPLPSRRQAKEPIAAEGLHAPALFCEIMGCAGAVAVADELELGSDVEAVATETTKEVM